MKRRSISIVIALGAAGGSLLGGCGSGQTRTVTESGNPPVSTPSTPAAAAPGPTTTPGSRTTTPGSASAGGTQASGATRTGSGPAFTQTGGSGTGGLSQALAALHSRGFSALDSSVYHRDQTLQVLVGALQGSTDAHVQQAFFFVKGRYIGTDTSQPSAEVRVVGQGDTEVTLSYALYRPHDALCCPTGGRAQVRYQLDNGKLAALDPIPTASAQAAASRL